MLNPGTRIGPYEILSPLGSGGMGEVYKARDPKLDRRVAIKILPQGLAEDPEIRARFEREAKAVAALSHPNILGIFDFGWDGSRAYAVMELLEGTSLRHLLEEGAIPPRKALEWAIQIARGVGAAHEKGIVHRDLKPDNLFLTVDGQIKVLDFGLAKPVEQPFDAASTLPPGAPNRTALSRAGAVIGTVGYMSPEQLRGQPVDPRSDIFSFGVVLYEMLTGRRPFGGASGAESVTAILRDEPPELSGLRGPVPPGLERVVFRCLEKRPQDRFQTMKDLAFGLEAPLSGLGAMTDRGARLFRQRPWLRRSLAGLALLAAGAAVLWLLPVRRAAGPEIPTFQRFPIAPGAVESACFGPDGKTLYFTARIGGEPPEIFALDPRSAAPKPLGLKDALLLGVSRSNELVFLQHPQRWLLGHYRGTLTQASASGDGIRILQPDVLEAAWDGQGLILLTSDNDLRTRLEFPVGKVALTFKGISHSVKLLRPSRTGDRLALVEAQQGNADVVVLGRDGSRSLLFHKPGDGFGDTLTGLAWGPGQELWLSERQGDQTALWALEAGRPPRLLWRGDGLKQLMDVLPDGRALLVNQEISRGVLTQQAGDPTLQAVSVRGGTQVEGLSADGHRLLLLESPVLDGGTALDETYLDDARGGHPIRFAKGNPYGFSLGGAWIQMNFNGLTPKDLGTDVTAALLAKGVDPAALLDPIAPRPCLVFVPTGPGHPIVTPLPGRFNVVDCAFLLPDGRQAIFQGSEQGHGLRYYRVDLAGGEPQPITEEGFGHNIVGSCPLSPDGKRLFITRDRKAWFILPLDGGTPEPVHGLRPGERLMSWTADGRALFVRPELSVLPVTIVRLDPVTGQRTLVDRFVPPDPSGYLQTRTAYATPDGKVFAFTYDRMRSDLYLMDGLR